MISVSHDPDFPDEATARPRVTHYPVPQSGLTSAKVDERVHSENGTIYRIDEPLLRELAGSPKLCRGQFGRVIGLKNCVSSNAAREWQAGLRSQSTPGTSECRTLAKTIAITGGLLPRDWHLERFFDLMNLENGLVVGALAVLLGGGFLLAATHQWRLTGFGRLDYAHTTRLIVPAAALIALGFQTVFFIFFTDILGLHRK